MGLQIWSHLRILFGNQAHACSQRSGAGQTGDSFFKVPNEFYILCIFNESLHRQLLEKD